MIPSKETAGVATELRPARGLPGVSDSQRGEKSDCYRHWRSIDALSPSLLPNFLGIFASIVRLKTVGHDRKLLVTVPPIISGYIF